MEVSVEKRNIDRAGFEDAAYMLKALSNEIRLSVILELSKEEERSVSELMNKIDCEQSLLSHHLTDMRAKGILSCRKSGKNCFYSLKNKRVTQLLNCLIDCSTNKYE